MGGGGQSEEFCIGVAGQVRIHFDVRLLDGTAISSSSESGPFEFVVNQRQVPAAS